MPFAVNCDVVSKIISNLNDDELDRFDALLDIDDMTPSDLDDFKYLIHKGKGELHLYSESKINVVRNSSEIVIDTTSWDILDNCFSDYFNDDEILMMILATQIISLNGNGDKILWDKSADVCRVRNTINKLQRGCIEIYGKDVDKETLESLLISHYDIGNDNDDIDDPLLDELLELDRTYCEVCGVELDYTDIEYIDVAVAGVIECKSVCKKCYERDKIVKEQNALDILLMIFGSICVILLFISFTIILLSS